MDDKVSCQATGTFCQGDHVLIGGIKLGFSVGLAMESWQSYADLSHV